MRVSATYGGFEELSRQLKRLPSAVENRVLASATLKAVKAAQPIVEAATPRGTGKQSPASEKYGPGHTNIKVRKKRSRRKNVRAARIDTGDAFWLHIYEKGSRYQAAKPFFGPAFRTAETLMITTLKSEIQNGLLRELAKKV